MGTLRRSDGVEDRVDPVGRVVVVAADVELDDRGAPILRDLDAEIRGLGIDPEAFLAGLRVECEARLCKCVRAGDNGISAVASGSAGVARAAGQ